MKRAQKYLVSWYDVELENNDSEIVTAISNIEAVQVISEGNEFAIDIYARVI